MHGQIEDYYTSQNNQLLQEFDGMAMTISQVLSSKYGNEFADVVIKETRVEFESLIPRIPYIGGKSDPEIASKLSLTKILILSAMFLALYRVMKSHGKTVEEIGKISHDTSVEIFRMTPPEILKAERERLYSPEGMNGLRELCKRLQKREYPEGWVATFVKGDGVNFEFGIDYTECGICKFYKANGAEEFTKYACIFDFVQSNAMKLGLMRTGTLAEGCEKCDFRYKYGGKEKPSWPPDWLK